MACTQIARRWLQVCWCVYFHSEMVRFQIQCNVLQCDVVCAIAVGRCCTQRQILWFYWKWKIAMIMNTQLLRQFNNNNNASLLFRSRSICLISHYHINVIAVVVVVVHILVRHRNRHFGIYTHTHTLLMAKHSWLLLFSFVILYLVFKVKFEFLCVLAILHSMAWFGSFCF